MENFSPANQAEISARLLKILKLPITWRFFQPGLKILAWFDQTGLGFLTRAELRPELKKSHVIENNKNNTNCIWKSIRSCIPKKSATQRRYSKDHKSVANEFNQFFSSVGENTIKKIKEMAATAECNYTLGRNSFQARNYPTSEQFPFTPVKCHQVEAIIKNMAPNKAPGIDKIPVRIIRDCLQAISYPLTSITSVSKR